DLDPPAPVMSYIYWGGGSGGVTPAYHAATAVIHGTGSGQRSSTSIIVGQILRDQSSRPFLQGGMVGSARLESTDRAYRFGAPAATADAGDGSDFFGELHHVLKAATADSN